ncbi:MAG: hypothetical protein HYZ42_14315 [Bacteroidetes bacterium]|nr:hypothetical protein [Bacteroidota bacterium]
MIQIRQPNIEELQNLEIDYFIAASGFESRATLQAEKFSFSSNKKYVFGFESETEDSIRIKNDRFFKNQGFTASIINGEDATISQLFDIIREIESNQKLELVVYVDYSCMTRNWYSYLLYGFFNMHNKEALKIYFGYSHAEFAQNNNKTTLNRIVSPLFGYCDFSIPSKPTALIIGLGNETNRIHGLKEYFDAVPYLYYSDRSYNEQYSQEIEILNQDILDKTNKNHIFKFPVYDLIYTNFMLENLCLTLEKDFRVIIAPCGPKPFALLAMINSLKRDWDIEVWRISPGHKIEKIDRKPTGLISAIELVFSNSNDLQTNLL